MLHPLVLIIVLSLVGYDAFGALERTTHATFALVGGALLGALAIIAIMVHIALICFGRQLDRTGSMRAMRRADITVSLSRIFIGLIFVAFVFAFDWIGAVRTAIGDWIGLDEIIVCAPPILAYAATWWSFYPIDRRLHEASMLRSLDTGRPIHAFPRRAAYTWEKLRYSMFAALLPIALILLWGETVSFAVDRWDLFPWPEDSESTMLALAGLQLCGAALVLICSPPILLALWETTPLPPGELRDRLTAMCNRHRVRTGGIRVWHTRGVILNGAVIGVIPRLRYVLLTDALIERLPANELDAVMAHEVGHVRKRHLPWLLGALIASLGLATWGMSWAMQWLHGREMLSGGLADAFDIGAFLIAITFAFMMFGFASRTFEREADAFAVQDASGLTRAAPHPSLEVTTTAAEGMAGALEKVARLNHIPQGKFSWRHGSIADRCRRIRRIIGLPVDKVPASRSGRFVRLTIAAGLLAFGAATLFDVWVWTQTPLEPGIEFISTPTAHIDDSFHENARHRE